MGLTQEGAGGIPATMLVGPANVGGAAYPAMYPYPVYPQQGGNGSGNDGFGGQDGWWIVLLIILLAAGNGFGNNNNGGGGAFGGGAPVIINDGNNNGYAVQRGFDQAALMSGITGVQSGVQNLSTQLCNCCADVQSSLCNGFAGVNSNMSNGFAQAEIANNARQMTNMQQGFANQMAMNQGFNQISSQFADCCCENRLASADLKYTIATENCADRAAISDGIRDIIANQTAGFQSIKDQLCQDKIDAKNEKIADLERQLTMADLRASQVAQTARLENSNSATVDALYNRLATCPVGTMPVYGSQPIFTCPQQSNNNCGCGCGNF